LKKTPTFAERLLATTDPAGGKKKKESGTTGHPNRREQNPTKPGVGGKTNTKHEQTRTFASFLGKMGWGAKPMKAKSRGPETLN